MTDTREEQIARIEVALEQLLGTQPWTPSLLSRSDRRLIATAITNAILATEAAPSEPLDDKLVYIKPLRTLVRVQTMYADQVRDLCNAPAAPSEPDTLASAIEETETENYADLVDMANVGKAFMRELANNMPGYSYLQCPSEVICDLINQNFDANAHPPAQPVQTPAQVSDADGRGKISLRVGTPAEIANYKAAFASMRSPSGQAAMMPMMESVGNNADTIQKLLGDFSTGELFNALLSRINFDGMDPRTFSLAELLGAIEGAEWPKASPTASQPDTTKSATQPSAAEANKETPKWLNGEPYYCSYCGLGGGEYAACEDVRCKLESPAVARLRRDNATAQPDTTKSGGEG